MINQYLIIILSLEHVTNLVGNHGLSVGIDARCKLITIDHLPKVVINFLPFPCILSVESVLFFLFKHNFSIVDFRLINHRKKLICIFSLMGGILTFLAGEEVGNLFW